MTIQDWGVTYDELEPYYDKFEQLCGTSGTAGNLQGKIQPFGNPYEGPRSRPYPTPAQKQPYGPVLWAEAAKEMGYQPVPRHPVIVASVHKSGRRHHRPVHLLWLLRAVRLRQLFDTDRFGRPLMRMTFDFHDNELKMSQF